MANPEIHFIDLKKSAPLINTEIKNAGEPYIAFYEEDAEYEKDYFTKLKDELARAENVHLATGSLPLGPKKQLLKLEKTFPKGISVLDTSEDFQYGLVYPYGLLIETAALQESGVRFPENLTYCRDEAFAMMLSQHFSKRLYLRAEKYRSNRTYDESSKLTLQSHDAAWYWDSTLPLLEILKTDWGNKGNRLPRCTQHALFYLTQQRYRSNEDASVKMVFANLAETEKYMEHAAQMLREIDDVVIFSNKPAIDWEKAKLLYLARTKAVGGNPHGKEVKLRTEIRKNDAALYYEGNDSGKPFAYMKGNPLIIQVLKRIEVDGQAGLDIEFRCPPLFQPRTYDIYFSNIYDGVAHDSKAQWTRPFAGLTTFFDLEAFTRTGLHVFVPLAEHKCTQTISAYAIIQGEKVPLKFSMWYLWQTRLNTNDPKKFWAIPEGLMRHYDWKLHLEPANFFARRKAEKEYQATLKKPWRNIRKNYFRTKQKFKNRRIWIYYDKGFKGGDNGEYAFRYAAGQNDGIEHVYCIGSDTVDGKRLIKAGYRVIEPGSEEAILYALNAEVIFCTHVPAYKKIGLSKYKVPYFKDLMNAKIIRMYHGFPITRNISYTQPYSDYSGVVVSTTYERDLYGSKDNSFKPEQIIECGNPRYDGLVSEDHKQILFAPTWRPALRGKIGKNGESDYNPDFTQSLYYQRYNQIMYSPRLLEACRKNGYKIKLFLHPRLAPQTVDFEKNDVVEPLDCTRDTDYVTIMRTSNLMITDYSSVMFDFAYMRKPVVYYQDPALPYWRWINYDYKSIGFGEVIDNPEALVDLLVEYVENDCALKPQYRERIESFFLHNDRNSAERLYEAVQKMI